MRVLVLEDDPNRVSLFKQYMPDEFIIDYVDNVKDAISHTHSNSYDMFFLDHDLGGEIYVDSSQYNTGYTFAKYIVEQGIYYEKIIVHSLNSVGAINICNVLNDVQYVERIPFPILIKELRRRV